MSEIASARINTFGTSPKAEFVQPEDPILEIPASELQSLLDEMVLTHNELAELVRDSGILRGRELARLTESHAGALKAERSPITKLMLLNACSKIMARAVQIIDYIKTYGEDDPKGTKRDVGLDSQQARLLFSGAGGEPVSRKETIRAMKRAEVLWPALKCGHRPNDGRQTMRLTIKRTDLGISPEFGYRDLWQRSGKDVSVSL
ncbi:MAG: hypothetical protein NTV30_00845 [Chloroflexi bacterium]|nr:hypothetical protein [Chloroflexota bacterium]